MASGRSLKERVQAGEVLIGAFLPPTVTRERLEQVLKFHPYDFIHVDSQHLPFSEERIAGLCCEAGELGVPVILRIKHPRNAYLVGAYADLGVSGVEVPQVESEETALEALDYFYYPPQGRRSSGGTWSFGFTPAPGKNHRVEYAEWWNRSGLLMLQVESLEAITMARRLAKLGVDCLSWGAAPHSADLAFSLENNPWHPFKSDDDCLRYTIQQLEGTSTRMFVRIDGPQEREKYIGMGATVLRENPPV